MPSPHVSKYHAIYVVLRQRILDGELAPGTQLRPQQALADEFGVTLMTLRQAVAALERDGLIWAARGKGTFVADQPIDISVGNLSSFAEQMRTAGIEMTTEVLGIEVVDTVEAARAALALETSGELYCLTRRRRTGGVPIALQRSYMERGVVLVEPGAELMDDSLYDSIRAKTGWRVAEAQESVTAIGLTPEDAASLETASGCPALLSIRTSINQFGRPFLYDEAVLVGGRCSIIANRTSERLSLQYGVADSGPSDPSF